MSIYETIRLEDSTNAFRISWNAWRQTNSERRTRVTRNRASDACVEKARLLIATAFALGAHAFTPDELRDAFRYEDVAIQSALDIAANPTGQRFEVA